MLHCWGPSLKVYFMSCKSSLVFLIIPTFSLGFQYCNSNLFQQSSPRYHPGLSCRTWSKAKKKKKKIRFFFFFSLPLDCISSSNKHTFKLATRGSAEIYTSLKLCPLTWCFSQTLSIFRHPHSLFPARQISLFEATFSFAWKGGEVYLQAR